MCSIDSVCKAGTDRMKKAVAISRDLSNVAGCVDLCLMAFLNLEILLPFSRDTFIRTKDKSILINIRRRIPRRKAIVVGCGTMRATRNRCRRITAENQRRNYQQQEVEPVHHGYWYQGRYCRPGKERSLGLVPVFERFKCPSSVAVKASVATRRR